jgi:hypothetical protein
VPFGDGMGRGSGWVAEKGTDAAPPRVVDRSVDLRRVDDVASIAGWDVAGVAKAPVRSYMVDRPGRVAGEARTQVRHEADHYLKVFFDVPYVSCLVAGVGSQASGEMSVLGKHVEH